MTSGGAHLTSEMLALLEHFTTLSEAGRRACECGDPDALNTALDARDAVAADIATLAGELERQRQALTTTFARDAFDATLRPVRAAALHASQRNAELQLCAQSARTALGEALDRLRHDSAAQSAYSAAMEPGETPQFDRVR